MITWESTAAVPPQHGMPVIGEGMTLGQHTDGRPLLTATGSGAALPTGTVGQYLRHTGAAWAASSLLLADLASIPWSKLDAATLPAYATRWPTWAEVTSKPTTFAPSAHTHPWTEVTSKPTEFPPAAHVHAIADVTGLQTALNGKLSLTGGTLTGALTVQGTVTATDFILTGSPGTPTGLTLGALDDVAYTGTPAATQVLGFTGTFGAGGYWTNVASGFAPATHDIITAHTASGLTAGHVLRATGATTFAFGPLQTTDVPTLGISKITGLQTALDGKAAATHTHTKAQITDFGHAHPWSDITSGVPVTATRWPTWTEVTDKPATFTPSGHGHPWSDITSGVPATATRWPEWSEVGSKPTTFAPASHSLDSHTGTLPVGSIAAGTFAAGTFVFPGWLTIAGTGASVLRLQGGSGTWNPWDIMSAYNQTNADLIFNHNGTERFRINASGHMTIGTAGRVVMVPRDDGVGPGYIEWRNASLRIAYMGYAPTGLTLMMESGTFDVFGTMTVSNTVTASDFILSSDERLKRDLLQIQGALGALDRIRGYRYWHTGNKRQEVGLLAQEVEAVLPEAVHYDAEGYRGVAYERLVPLLIEAIRELRERLDG